VAKQNDVRLRDRGEAQGGYAVGGLLDVEARFSQHHRHIEARPSVVVDNQSTDPLA
jgi:hypothetical protein